MITLILDSDSAQGDVLSLVILLHGQLSDYAHTHDEESEEESEPTSEPEEGLCKEVTGDKLGLLCALWKIHQSLMMQTDRVKTLLM